MTDRLDACLPFVLREEGGFVNDLHDPGGATNQGITIATFRAWRHDPTATVAQLRAITPAETRAIYGTLYFQAAACDRLPIGLDLAVFDGAVNTGVRRAAMQLQAAAGCTQDGHLGPVTLLAAKALPLGPLLDRLQDEMERFYRSLPTFGRFGRGWLNRVGRRMATARTMAGPVKTGSSPAVSQNAASPDPGNRDAGVVVKTGSSRVELVEDTPQPTADALMRAMNPGVP